MKSFDQPVTLPLDYTTELVMEIHLMRADCSDAAEDLMEESTIDEVSLEECAVLDDALARAHIVLQGAVRRIEQLRAARKPAA